jgi:hypothetical protein
VKARNQSSWFPGVALVAGCGLLAVAVALHEARPVQAQAAAPVQNGDVAGNQNQQRARAVLDAMIAAMGGQRWLSVQTIKLEGRNAGFYQGTPTGTVEEFTEYRKFPNQTRIEIGKKHDVIQIFDGSRGWEITYRGEKEMAADQLQDHIRQNAHSIEAALRVWLNDPTTLLLYDGQNLVERRLADQVTLISSRDDSITIQIDAETHLPLRRSWQWRDPLYKDKNTDAEEYDDYHPVQGIPTPLSVTRFHNGDMTNQEFITAVEYNAALPPDAFNPALAAVRKGK